ncbi:hypothetical protein Tco_0910118 [Tanacetum coccineum]|uniref:Uncharacterized protein n=1 Tax=Tanacetum coccineum TaxID=301880 RepID=A0ABQ5CSC8_9ASTR
MFDDRERDEIAEATLLSLALHKTAIAAEARENVAKVQEKLAEEEIEKMVEGEEDEESYASEFANFVLNDDDSGTRIEPRNHEEHLKTVDDDDENENENETKDDDKKDDYNDDHIDHTLVGNQDTGSMETRKEKMQKPIPSPTRSPRKNLSLDKTLSQELMEILSPSNAITSKAQSKTRCISSKYSHIPGVIHRMCRHQGYMIHRMEKKYVTDREFWKVHRKVDKEDDAPPKGEKEFKSSKSARSSSSKQPASTYARMMATLNDVMSNPFKDAKENRNEPLMYLYNKDLIFLRYGNTEERSYILSLHKIHVVPFSEDDLEEKLKRWVRKEFKTFNEEAQLSIHHWKESWH